MKLNTMKDVIIIFENHSQSNTKTKHLNMVTKCEALILECLNTGVNKPASGAPVGGSMDLCSSKSLGSMLLVLPKLIPFLLPCT